MSKIKEIVELYKEAVQEIKASGLEEGLFTPDVIQKIVITAFIDGKNGHGKVIPFPSKHSTGGAVEGEENTFTGIVQKKEATKVGKGTKYAIQVNNHWYSCFDRNVFKGKVEEGMEVKVVWKLKDGKYKNLVSVEPCGENEEDDQPPF